MKKLLLMIFCVSSHYLFAQVTTQDTTLPAPTPPPPAPTQQPTTSQPSQPSKLRLNAYALYAFDDAVDSYYSNTSYFNGTIEGGFEWGAGLEYMIRSNKGIELTYLRLDTKAPMNYYDNGEAKRDFDLSCNYILIGGNNYFGRNAKVEPYLGFQLGMCIFDVSNAADGQSHSSTKFAWGIKAGTNIWLSEKVGLKLHTSLLSATQAAGGGMYFGTGGVGAGVSSYSSMYQFNIGGGLAFKLGGN